MRKIKVGEIELSLINIGDLKFRLTAVIDEPDEVWRPRFGKLFEEELNFPSQSVYFESGGISVLVDAGEYSKFASADSTYSVKGYIPPPGLPKQLWQMGVAEDGVAHVVITHAHYDHYAGVTSGEAGSLVPTYPNARYHLGEADLNWSEMVKALADPQSNESQTFGVLQKLGMLYTVKGELEIISGVNVLPAPGESPGHQVVRISSKGMTAYCLGDLFHHYVEVENPTWMASWCDRESNKKSRANIIDKALREDAILLPAHMPPGKLVREGSQIRYHEV